MKDKALRELSSMREPSMILSEPRIITHQAPTPPTKNASGYIQLDTAASAQQQLKNSSKGILGDAKQQQLQANGARMMGLQSDYQNY